MTSKAGDRDKRFPLSLSALTDKAGRSGPAPIRARVATPQTATQNAARNLAPRGASGPVISQPERRAVDDAAYSGVRQTPLVSDSVRRAMVARIARQGVVDTKVLSAMEVVQRHLFMEPGMVGQAYVDASIPIGYHQTISQPYIVARMIEVMRNGASLDRVLEIGTGCGYQAAVMARLAREVYSVERIVQLVGKARQHLRELRLNNVRLKHADGGVGLPDVAPFDGIIMAAAATHIPQTLLSQLAIGGRLVLPLGSAEQHLHVVERTPQGYQEISLEVVKFVPLLQGVM